MSKKLRFIWIDDDLDRESTATSLQERLNAMVAFKNANRQDLLSLLGEIRREAEPDLILMDHRFTKAEKQFFGSTAAEHLREKWPDCPIVCVTAARLEEVDAHKSALYEQVIELDKLSECDLILVSIAESFRKLRGNPPENTEQLINYLKAPKDDRQRLEAVIPDGIKMTYKDKKSSLLLISKWVRNTLMKKPGFLYDKLWAATLLGIKKESFHKVRHLFTKAKYSGIFAHKEEDLWWQSKVRSILSSLVESDKVLLPWEMGRLLPDITPKDYSKCYKSSEDFPEIVAYIDESATDRAPMRLRYTDPHPRFDSALFFEEIRMMKGRE